jgi:hypothetical protein
MESLFGLKFELMNEWNWGRLKKWRRKKKKGTIRMRWTNEGKDFWGWHGVRPWPSIDHERGRERKERSGGDVFVLYFIIIECIRILKLKKMLNIVITELIKYINNFILKLIYLFNILKVLKVIFININFMFYFNFWYV